MTEREREVNKALADIEYWTNVMYTNLLNKEEYERADSLLSAYNTVEYLLSEMLKEEE